MRRQCGHEKTFPRPHPEDPVLVFDMLTFGAFDFTPRHPRAQHVCRYCNTRLSVTKAVISIALGSYIRNVEQQHL